ncbi:hypothetical protein FJT64_015800 [Amphibalanus amphitrite]|uniref:Uncharacterized protein n=1 Tax=Amphibalanus amphitrite TaxID=1232801 RepID=A0A6A4XG72_AMPAM|nr:hypothetical protein FJT64_015800 [Amphibalanus amphitrite]
MITAEADGIGRPRALGSRGGLPYRRGVGPTPLEEKARSVENGAGKEGMAGRVGWPAPIHVANPPRDSLAGIIGLWMRFWSRVCLLGVLQCPPSGWGRLPWFLLRAVLAATLMTQAVAFIRTLPNYPISSILFMAIQACQHFSLLQFLLPALSFRAGAFPRALNIMARTQALPVFADLRLERPKFRLKLIYIIAVKTFLFMIVLHVVGGLLAVRHQREIGDDVSRFSLFPPVVRAESVVVHSLLVLLQFVHLVSVYGANLLSVSTVHSINVFLYSHLTHLSRHVSKLLTRRRAASGAVWNAANSDQGANVRPWNELLEAHSLLWE